MRSIDLAQAPSYEDSQRLLRKVDVVVSACAPTFNPVGLVRQFGELRREANRLFPIPPDLIIFEDAARRACYGIKETINSLIDQRRGRVTPPVPMGFEEAFGALLRAWTHLFIGYRRGLWHPSDEEWQRLVQVGFVKRDEAA